MLDAQTSMLYTSHVMNKPNLPDEIWLGKVEYSAWKDLQVNGWLMVAAVAVFGVLRNTPWGTWLTPV